MPDFDRESRNIGREQPNLFKNCNFWFRFYLYFEVQQKNSRKSEKKTEKVNSAENSSSNKFHINSFSSDLQRKKAKLGESKILHFTGSYSLFSNQESSH